MTATGRALMARPTLVALDKRARTLVLAPLVAEELHFSLDDDGPRACAITVRRGTELGEADAA